MLYLFIRSNKNNSIFPLPSQNSKRDNEKENVIIYNNFLK